MATRPRPLSPHLQVYRWQIQMVTSILHRATGIVLTIGAVLIALAMLSLASGPEGWGRVGAYAGSVPGLIFLLGWTWAYVYHLLNGIRHLAQDMGWGCSIPAFVRNSWISVIGSLLLSAVMVGLVATKAGWL
jgi:succinate dehydrogenase / fumarate reductase cytochrome b subunit